jgi:hypothetical protein
VRAVQPLRPRGAGESRILARGRPDERGETVLNGNWVLQTVQFDRLKRREFITLLATADEVIE